MVTTSARGIQGAPTFAPRPPAFGQPTPSHSPPRKPGRTLLLDMAPRRWPARRTATRPTTTCPRPTAGASRRRQASTIRAGQQGGFMTTLGGTRRAQPQGPMVSPHGQTYATAATLRREHDHDPPAHKTAGTMGIGHFMLALDPGLSATPPISPRRTYQAFCDTLRATKTASSIGPVLRSRHDPERRPATSCRQTGGAPPIPRRPETFWPRSRYRARLRQHEVDHDGETLSPGGVAEPDYNERRSRWRSPCSRKSHSISASTYAVCRREPKSAR